MSTRWTVIIVVLAVIGLATALFARHFQHNQGTLRIGDDRFRVLVADDDEERVRGLGGLPSLDEHTVMLFIFPNDDRHGIWMKGMRFAIDIIWLDRYGRVVDIERGVAPETYPTVFLPDTDARYVIEMSAGGIERFDIQLGQRVEAWPSG